MTDQQHNKKQDSARQEDTGLLRPFAWAMGLAGAIAVLGACKGFGDVVRQAIRRSGGKTLFGNDDE